MSIILNLTCIKECVLFVLRHGLVMKLQYLMDNANCSVQCLSKKRFQHQIAWYILVYTLESTPGVVYTLAREYSKKIEGGVLKFFFMNGKF